MIEKYLISFIISLLYIPLFAQNKIAGKILAEDNKDIIYKIVVEYVNSTQTMTESFYNSDFEMNIDSIGKIQLSIYSSGYETYKIQKTLRSTINNLGTITLSPKTIQLGEVIVKAHKIDIEYDGSNYTIRNVQGTHIGNAGNLLDMLKWTPGVVVTNQSDISVVGSGDPIIYINNRKIIDKAELYTISSTDVNKIDIIKEPNAQYKNGTNAVIKIYLKKQLKNHLGVIIGNSLDITRKYTERPNINISGKSGFISGDASLTYRKSKQLSYDEYMNTITHSNNSIFKNSSKGQYGVNMDTYMLFGGLNLALSHKSTLGVQYSGFFTDNDKNSFHDMNIDDNGITTTKAINSDGNENRKYHSASTSYVWNRNKNSILTLIADYAYRNNKFDNEVTETNLIASKTYLTPTTGSSDYKIYTFNGDYSFKTGKKDNEQLGIEVGNTKNNSGSTIDELSQTINRTNKWLAVYGLFRSKYGKFNYSLGLRYEYDYTDTKVNGNNNTTLKKTYSNIFPDAKISYQHSAKEVYSISYRKSISRPSFSQLSPIVNYEDSLHYWSGNPLLKPSFTNTLSFTANLSNLTLSTSYYYITNPIVSIYMHNDENPNILINKPDNINHLNSWDIGTNYSLSTGKFDFSTTCYLTYDKIKYPYLDKETSYNTLHVYLSGDISYSYHNYEIFANTNYMSPWRNGTQKMGYTLNTDIGIADYFFKKKLYIAVSGNDLFAKSVTPWWTNNYGDTEYWRRNRYDTRSVNFTLRYTLNVIKSPFKRKSGNESILKRAD
jgi:hypothetical protein